MKEKDKGKKALEVDLEGTRSRALRKERMEELRQEAEEAIHERDSLLWAVFESSREGMFIIDTEGRYVDVNQAGSAMFGYSREEFIGKDVRLLLFPEDVEKAFKRGEKSWREGAFAPELRMRRKDGSVIWVEMTTTPFKAGGRDYCLCIKRDITERKRATDRLDAEVRERTRELSEAVRALEEETRERRRAYEELKKSEERLNEAQKIAHIGNWDWDIVNDTLFWSDEIYRIFGLEPRAFGATYEAFLSTVHPDDREAVKAAVDDALGRRKEYSIDHRIVHPGGAVRTVHEEARVVFDPSGRPLRMAGTVQDITERKRMEEEVLKVRKLESIGDIAGGIAHDFNNILLGIIGNVSIAKQMVKPGDKVRSLLDEMEKAGMRAKGLTRQILTFSRGGEPVKDEADLGDIVRTTAGIVLRNAKDVECEYDLPEGLHKVFVDEGQVSQVFNNVVLNSVHAMPKGGRIRIKASNVRLSGDEGLPLKEGDYVKVSIIDTGTGIPREMLPRIFDPFFTTKERASGLGLAVSFSIIKKHRGHIMAESEKGRGTSVHIYLPAPEKKGPEAEPALHRAVAEPDFRARVLVMDDEEIVRDVAGEMLKLLGYEAGFATNGMEAVELYGKALSEGEPYSAVIMDLTIPDGMGGIETLEKLRKLDPGVKAIVSSGYSRDPVMADYRKYGFSGVIAKPYRVSEFSKAVKSVVSGS